MHSRPTQRQAPPPKVCALIAPENPSLIEAQPESECKELVALSQQPGPREVHLGPGGKVFWIMGYDGGRTVLLITTGVDAAAAIIAALSVASRCCTCCMRHWM